MKPVATLQNDYHATTLSIMLLSTRHTWNSTFEQWTRYHSSVLLPLAPLHYIIYVIQCSCKRYHTTFRKTLQSLTIYNLYVHQNT